MRHLALAFSAAALVLGSSRADAQDRDLLPMQFVRVDSAVFAQLEADWYRLQGRGKEWAYCVTSWTVALTQDADTIFLVNGLSRAPAKSENHEISAIGCPSVARLGWAGPPIVHAHPSGDCSPSRADATYAVAHATPFALIICGPRSTAGYTSQQYLWISRGALSERGAVVAPEPQKY